MLDYGRKLYGWKWYSATKDWVERDRSWQVGIYDYGLGLSWIWPISLCFVFGYCSYCGFNAFLVICNCPNWLIWLRWPVDSWIWLRRLEKMKLHYKSRNIGFFCRDRKKATEFKMIKKRFEMIKWLNSEVLKISQISSGGRKKWVWSGLDIELYVQ